MSMSIKLARFYLKQAIKVLASSVPKITAKRLKEDYLRIFRGDNRLIFLGRNYPFKEIADRFNGWAEAFVKAYNSLGIKAKVSYNPRAFYGPAFFVNGWSIDTDIVDFLPPKPKIIIGDPQGATGYYEGMGLPSVEKAKRMIKMYKPSLFKKTKRR